MDVEEQTEMTLLNNGSCPIELLLLLYEAFKAHDKHYKSVTNMAPFFSLSLFVSWLLQDWQIRSVSSYMESHSSKDEDRLSSSYKANLQTA